jgi:hypothetical protein
MLSFSKNAKISEKNMGEKLILVIFRGTPKKSVKSEKSC